MGSRPKPTTESLTFTAGPEDAGVRLDKVVVRRARGLGRKGAAALFARGSVCVDGRPVAKSHRTEAGSRVSVELGAPRIAPPEPDAPLFVRHRTAALVVVSKPAGQPSVPRTGDDRGTLAGALVGHFPEMAGVGRSPLEPGLLHRLDTQTSGLVVAARNELAFERLRAALASGKIEKRYLAVVDPRGLPPAGVVDRPLGPDPRGGPRVRVAREPSASPGGGRQTATRYRVVDRHADWALLEIRVSRAYRHQIRAHLAWLGHPIAGDTLYGGPRAPALGQRHALHASYVAWAGDDDVAGFAVSDPLPPSMGILMGRPT